jgi:hypothetical protein
MKIDLTKEEWEYLKCSWQHERSHAYRSYVRDKEFDIKLDLLNLYDDLLAKLGSEWENDVKMNDKNNPYA